MFCRKHKLLAVLFVYLATCVSAGAQEALDNLAVERMEREVARLLLEKDVGVLANETAREKDAASVLPLLRRLSIFARAGHRTRVLETLNRLADATDMPPVSHRWVVAGAVKKIIGSEDLALLRSYYERIMPVDAHSAEGFLRLWEATADTKELDAWLAARVKDNAEWMRWRIHWRAKLGTAGELLDALAAEVKANPQESERVRRYLQANNWANNLQNISWLADVLRPESAYEFYELGTLLQQVAPATAAKMLERSLALAFTERDMQFIRERIIVMYSMPPRVKNWEKQFRFWTKRHLAEVYKANAQPHLAQPLVEELVRMKAEDDTLEDVHQLAGAVQAQSGMRVVEAKILRDEATEKGTADYWLNRAQYYIGRKEFEAAMDSYRSALVHVPLKPQDKTSLRERFHLLKSLAWFGASRFSPDGGRRDEVKQILLREFNSVPPENEYAFWVAQIIIDNELEFDDLIDTLFVTSMDVPARLLTGRAQWENEDEALIDSVVCRERRTPEQKNYYWTQLEALAKTGSPSRAYRLGSMMMGCHESRRAIPLLVSYLEYIRGRKSDDEYSWEGDASDLLFRAYLETGDWQRAEKFMLQRGQAHNGYDLSRIALAAARAGAIDDAERLWRTKMNLDRRQLQGLSELAETKAREPLRRLYLEMKKRDPLSTVPDRALKILQ